MIHVALPYMNVCLEIKMTTRSDFLACRTDGLFKLDGFDADDGIFLRHLEAAGEFAEHLEDILWEMDSPSFDGEDWINDDFAILAVLGAGEGGWVVQPQAFLLHSMSSGHVHLLEMAPPEAATFEELPVVAESLNELETMIQHA